MRNSIDYPIGTILMYAGNNTYNDNWLFCDGTIFYISDFPNLFDLIKTTYGGDGVWTFAVPDFRGRLLLGEHPAPNQDRNNENEYITIPNLPIHKHTLHAIDQIGDTDVIEGSYIAKPNNNMPFFGIKSATEAYRSLNFGSIKPEGKSQPHNNMPPYLAINFIICSSGVRE